MNNSTITTDFLRVNPSFFTNAIDTVLGVGVGVGALFTAGSHQATFALSAKQLGKAKEILARPYQNLVKCINPKAVFEDRGGLVAAAVKKPLVALAKSFADSPKLFKRQVASRLTNAVLIVSVVIARIVDLPIGIIAATFSILMLGKCKTINHIAFNALQTPAVLKDVFIYSIRILNPWAQKTSQNVAAVEETKEEIKGVGENKEEGFDGDETSEVQPALGTSLPVEILDQEEGLEADKKLEVQPALGTSLPVEILDQEEGLEADEKLEVQPALGTSLPIEILDQEEGFEADEKLEVQPALDTSLPVEILEEIFDFAGYRSLFSMSQVCSLFNAIIQNKPRDISELTQEILNKKIPVGLKWQITSTTKPEKLDALVNAVIDNCIEIEGDESPKKIVDILFQILKSFAAISSAPNFSAKETLLSVAARFGHTELVKLLIDNFSVEPTADAFTVACERGYLEIFNTLMDTDKIDPSENGNIAISWASEGGYLPIVERLAKDPRVDVRKAMSIAQKKGYNQILSCLLDRPDADTSVLYFHLSSCSDSNLIKKILLHPKTSPSKALEQACALGLLDLAKDLIQDPRITPHCKNITLIAACEYGRLEVVKQLLEDKDINLTFTTRGRDSAICVAKERVEAYSSSKNENKEKALKIYQLLMEHSKVTSTM